MKRILALAFVLAIAVLFVGCENKEDSSMDSIKFYKTISEVPAGDASKLNASYQSAAPQTGDIIAVLKTSMGDIKLRFFPEAAPIAVNNFIALAMDGRYDGTIFHRVISGFMIQGGDYTEFNGYGGESIYGEDFDLEISEYLSNIPGSVAMANRGPGTNGSQFYINQVSNTYLDGSYTVFAQVYEGMDVVNAIASVDTNYNDKPLTDVRLNSVEIKRN